MCFTMEHEVSDRVFKEQAYSVPSFVLSSGTSSSQTHVLF